MINTAIIGAGISGLSAAYQLKQNAREARIFEANDQPGGLLAPIVIDGFTFDTAVHLSFASEPEVRAVFDQAPYLTHAPESICWDNGYWLKHPVQTNLFPLPLEEKTALIAGLATSPSGPIENYRDWLVQQYGLPIAERWPLAYTKKYWTVGAEQLGTVWVGQRMRKADLKEVIAGAISPETENHYYVKEMRYPRQGGYYAFLAPLVAEAHIEFGHRVIEVNPLTCSLAFENGRTVSYENLISTMPLPRLVECIADVPDHIRADAASLFATSMDLISVGFKRPDVPPALWFYIYDKDILAARAYSPDRKSPGNVPPGCSALQFEIYSSRERPQTHSVEDLKRNTIEGLRKMNLCSTADILFVEHTRAPYANVVFDLGMEERRDRVRDYISSLGIRLAGRFGEWDYLWSNQAFMSGHRAANGV